MTSGAHTREGWFIEVGWGLHGVLLGSQAFVKRLYLSAKPSHVGSTWTG
jgi:hypothetical protein